jgi:hypothetical protein
MPRVSAQLTYRAYFPGGMMFMLPAGLTLFAVCTFPTPFSLFFAAFAIVFGYVLTFRTAWTIRLEGDQLCWRVGIPVWPPAGARPARGQSPPLEPARCGYHVRQPEGRVHLAGWSIGPNDQRKCLAQRPGG